MHNKATCVVRRRRSGQYLVDGYTEYAAQIIEQIKRRRDLATLILDAAHIGTVAVNPRSNIGLRQVPLLAKLTEF